MERRFVLDAVIRQRAAIREDVSGEDETLLVGKDTKQEISLSIPKSAILGHLPLSVLDLDLDRTDGIGRFDLEGDGLVSESLDEDLHPGGLDVARAGRERGSEGEGVCGRIYPRERERPQPFS